MNVPEEEYEESSEWRLRSQVKELEDRVRNLSEKLMDSGRAMEVLREEIKFLRTVILNLSGRKK